MQLQQWRQDAERPVLAKVITTSERSLAILEDTMNKRNRWMNSMTHGQIDNEARDEARRSWETDSNEFEELRYQVAQLDLIAGEPLRQAAHALFWKHSDLRHVLRPSSGGEGDLTDSFMAYSNEIVDLRQTLINLARVDLGISPRVRITFAK